MQWGNLTVEQSLSKTDSGKELMSEEKQFKRQAGWSHNSLVDKEMQPVGIEKAG